MANQKTTNTGETGASSGSVGGIIADMSTHVLAAQAALAPESTRREQWRAAQQRRRKALADSGAIKLEILLTPEQAEVYKTALALQSGPCEGFALRSLLTGAKFLANSGNKRGGKQRLKGGAK